VLLLGIIGGFVVLLPRLGVPSPTPTPAPTPLPSTPSPTPSPSGENPAPSSFNFEPIGKWTVSTGGATAGSMLLNLKSDHTYEITNTSGTFQQVGTVIGSSGTWTFNRSDMSLTILGTGSRYGLAMRISGKQNNSYTAVGVDGINYLFTPG